MGLRVFKECCKNCLLSEDRIVSPKRAKDLIKECTSTDNHFICHKASKNGEEIICNKFFQTIRNSQMIRIAERLNVLDFVEQTDIEKLPTYKEMRK